MKVVVQRVSSASVTLEGGTCASIGKGFVILLGIRKGDTTRDADFLASKCIGLRVMGDEEGKMNLSLADVGGSVIVVSQFTLYGDAQRGNRPSFIEAAQPTEAEPLYERFVERVRASLGPERVGTGVFGAMMEVKIINDGPVTILLESRGRE